MLSGSGFLALSWSSCCPGLGFRGLGFKGWGFRGLGFGVTIMSRSLETKGTSLSLPSVRIGPTRTLGFRSPST